MEFSAVGRSSEIDGETFILTRRGETGFVVFGPYHRFEPGRYHVAFQVRADEAPESGDDLLAGYIDVSSSEGALTLARANLYARRSAARGGEIILPFEVPEPLDLEFRVWSSGRAPLRVRYDRPVGRDGVADLASRPKAAGADRKFHRKHRHHLDFLSDHGIDFEVEDDHALVHARGLTLRVTAGEEFQVLNEVFLANDYTFRSARQRVVIDVGMNAAFAALLFASDRDTQQVHAFEPFATPYRRALANLDLNPDCARKIAIHRVALSNRTYDATVRIDEHSTIGVSLDGHAHGPEELIAVRDAAEALGPIVRDARERHRELVMKLDCEGSEFAVIESLNGANLLDGFDVIMIEWHKWWAVDRTQADLIRPLNAAGFVVFDQTNPADQYAGMLYAVNARAIA